MVWTRKNLEWWCERGILSLILAMLVFAPLAFGAVEPWGYLTVEAMAAGVFILWIARLWVTTRTKVLWPPLAWVVLVFALYAVGRYFTADIEYVARLETLLVLTYAGVFLVAMNTLRGQEETERVSYTLIGLAALIACYGIGQWLSHSDRVWDVFTTDAVRAKGTYISPNHFAGFLELILPLGLAFLLVGKVKILGRILLGYAVVTIALGLIGSFSRAGWVAAAAGNLLILAILVCHRNHRFKAMILLALMLAAGGVFVSRYVSQTTGFRTRISAAQGSAGANYDWHSRLKMWDAAERMWLDHPWWGVGPAHYDYRFREYRPPDLQARPDRCHNDYLNLLVDWGIAGGVIVLAGMILFAIGLFTTWPHVRREENTFGSGRSNRFAFFLGATGGLASLAVHSVMDFNLHIPANALIAVILLALLTSNLRFATERHWLRAGLPLKTVLTLLLGALVVVIALQEYRQGREAYWQSRAGREEFSPDRAAALEKTLGAGHGVISDALLFEAALLENAFAAEPGNFQTAYDIGECYRTEGWDGGRGYEDRMRTAQQWYRRAIALNPHDAYSHLRLGMCADRLDDPDGAGPCYSQAEALDPNGYYLAANLGWHYVQTGDYAAARQCFLRSIGLYGNNMTAMNYYVICENKLIDQAKGNVMFPGFFH